MGSGGLRDRPPPRVLGFSRGFWGVTHRVGMSQPAPFPAVHDVQPPALVISAVGSTGNLGDGEGEGSGGFGQPPPVRQEPPKSEVLIWQQGREQRGGL